MYGNEFIELQKLTSDKKLSKLVTEQCGISLDMFLYDNFLINSENNIGRVN
jgi:hypothetical protein